MSVRGSSQILRPRALFTINTFILDTTLGTLQPYVRVVGAGPWLSTWLQNDDHGVSVLTACARQKYTTLGTLQPYVRVVGAGPWLSTWWQNDVHGVSVPTACARQK